MDEQRAEKLLKDADIALRQADMYCRGMVSKLPFPDQRGLL